MGIAPENTDVVILCGGLGTRLRASVSDRPKPMADIQQTPFVQILIEQFRGFGFRRFILCTGYMSEVVQSYFDAYTGDVDIVISEEPKPLGTAGAIRYAQAHIQSDPFLTTNGDSFCAVPLDRFLGFHAARAAQMSMVVTATDQSQEYGSVGMDQTGRITHFQEKTQGLQSGLVNAGIYLLQQHIFHQIPPGTRCSPPPPSYSPSGARAERSGLRDTGVGRHGGPPRRRGLLRRAPARA